MKAGRPSKFTPELASEICRRLSDGESLREICRGEGKPPESTVRQWVTDDMEGFAAQYTRARQAQAHALADELLEIADDGSNDWMKRQNKSGDMVDAVDHEHVTRSALRVNTRKWILAKMLPKLYGDRLDTTTTTLGADGQPIDPTRHTVIVDDGRPAIEGFAAEWVAGVDGEATKH